MKSTLKESLHVDKLTVEVHNDHSRVVRALAIVWLVIGLIMLGSIIYQAFVPQRAHCTTVLVKVTNTHTK